MNRCSRVIMLGVAVLCFCASGLAAEPAPTLTIVVQNIKSAAGSVRLALWDTADGFTLPEKALAELGLPATAGEVAFRFEDLKPGRYALATFHDENGNNELDRTWLGWPDEGLAFSNGAWISLGPPSFEDAAFEVGPEPRIVRVSLRY